MRHLEILGARPAVSLRQFADDGRVEVWSACSARRRLAPDEIVTLAAWALEALDGVPGIGVGDLIRLDRAIGRARRNHIAPTLRDLMAVGR